MIDRRSFIRAALFVAAAPVIVRAPKRGEEYPLSSYLTSQSTWTLTYGADGAEQFRAYDYINGHWVEMELEAEGDEE